MKTRSTQSQPLLQHKHQDSRDENHKADTQTTTAGPDRKTSASQELELAGRDQAGCSSSVRSSCSNSSRHECPICSELFDSRGDHRVTLLNCDHKLCHQCIAGVMRGAKDPGRLRCPFCRQTTPFPQWEIRRLQEESYSVYEPKSALIIGSELQAMPASQLVSFVPERQQTRANICGCCPSCLFRGLRLIRLHSLCFSIAGLLLLFLVPLGCFICVAVPFIMLYIFYSDG